MANSLDAILKKKGWTGEEVGKVLIYSLIDNYKQTLSGNPDAKPILSDSQMRNMISSIKSPEQGRIYNRYVELNNWLQKYFSIAMHNYQQAKETLARLCITINTAHAAEENYRYIENLPAIMTQKQYDEIRAQRIEETLTDENGEDLAHGLFNLVELAIEHFIRQLDKDPRKANPFKAIKKNMSKSL